MTIVSVRVCDICSQQIAPGLQHFTFTGSLHREWAGQKFKTEIDRPDVCSAMCLQNALQAAVKEITQQ